MGFLNNLINGISLGSIYAVIISAALATLTPISFDIEGRMGDTTQLSAITTKPANPRINNIFLVFKIVPPKILSKTYKMLLAV